jgi:hypothetical protein
MTVETLKLHESIFDDAASMVRLQLNATGITLSNFDQEELALALETFVKTRSEAKIDVLRSSDGHSKPLLSSLIADFVPSDSLNASNEDALQEEFRIVVEKGDNCIYFSAFPTLFENGPFSERGLTGCLEIRDGQPALSVGLDVDEYFMHLQSDVVSGITVKSNFRPINRGQNIYFKYEGNRWLEEARCHLVYKHLETQHGITINSSDWLTKGDSVRTKATFNNAENQLKTLTAQYEFYPNSWVFNETNSEITA